MMSRTLALPLSLLASALLSAPAAAQLSLELRGGAGAGSYQATGAGFQAIPGAAFRADAGYAFSPTLSVYAGYGRAGFGCEEGFCAGADPTFTSSGVDAGLRVGLPARFWARGGVVRHRLGVSATRAGSPYRDHSGSAIGLEAGLGYTLGMGRRLSLTPGIGYLRYTPRFADGTEDPVAVLTAEVGMRVSLPGGR